MIFARQHKRLSLILVNNWKCPVAADIEERINVPCSIFDNEKGIASHFIASVFAWLAELMDMRD